MIISSVFDYVHVIIGRPFDNLVDWSLYLTAYDAVNHFNHFNHGDVVNEFEHRQRCMEIFDMNQNNDEPSHVPLGIPRFCHSVLPNWKR